MITTRTRILSILATVAMLVSMLACFVIPASAEGNDPIFEQVLADIANKESTQLYQAWNNGTAYEDLLTTAASEAGTTQYTWITTFDGDDPGENLENAYPRFAYHAAYEAAGYTKANGKVHWSITEVADWNEMNTVAKADTSVYVDATTGKYFEGITFHLTNNVDFKNAGTQPPLGARDGRIFSGTINGHGNGFNNVTIESFSAKENYYSNAAPTGSIGLIAFLGSCTIQDFGVNSGTIDAAVAKYGSVSTFGCVASGLTTPPTFTRVWSGVTLKGSKTTTAGKRVYMNALVGEYNNTAGAVKVNGFVFDGEMKKAGAGSTVFNAGYGVYGAVDSAPCDNSEFYNIITYPKDTGAAALTTFVLHFSTENAFKTAKQNNKIANVYGLARNDDKVGIAESYRSGVGNSLTEGSVDNTAGDGAYNLLFPMSANGVDWTAKEAAWTANKNTYNPTQQEADAVYFTLKGSKVRPIANAAGRIVRYTYDVENSEDDQVVYANAGTSVDVRSMFSIGADENIIVTVNDNPVSPNKAGRYKITDDAVITIEKIDYDALMAQAKTKLEKLDPQYLSNSDDLTTIKNNLETIINKAEATNAEKQTVIDAANGFTPLLYGEDNYTKLPGYSLYDIYKDYNDNKVWAIREAADWLAMVAASNDTENPQTFADHTFHVLNNIDFADDDNPNGKLMDPLNYGDGKNSSNNQFKGTIKGYNHSFKNVNISKSVDDTTAEYLVGLIAKLGADANISDFGVESGTIEFTGTAKNVYISTFGRAFSGARLNNVWSGATITATNNNDEANNPSIAAGIVAPSAGSNLAINGAYFYGSLNAKRMYGILHELHQQTIKNALSAPTYAGDSNNKEMHARRSLKEDETYAYSVLNNFSVGSPIYEGYDPAAEGAAADANVVNSKTVDSAREGAWEINDAQAKLAEDDRVYFKLTENEDIRPFGTATDRIVKFDGMINQGKSNEKQDARYANTGEVDVRALFNLTGIAEDSITTFIVTSDGSDTPLTPVGGTGYTYNIEGDVTVEISYAASETEINNAYTALQQALEEKGYNDLTETELAHFKDINEVTPGNIDLATFRSDLDAAKTAGDLDKLIELNGYITGKKLQVEVSEKIEKFPAFKDHKTYIDYNKKQNWLIEDLDDWKAMNQIAITLELENGEPTEEYNKYINTQQRYFLGFTFHLTEDVDFSATKDAPILPLVARDGRKFSGTINGHGNGFNNINIVVNAEHIGSETGYYEDGTMNGSVGLIAYIGKDAKFIDFGINSGTITAETGGNAGSVSSFGSIAAEGEDAVATFTRVWSGATLLCKERARKNVYLNALVGLINTVSRKIKVNGFVFSGEMGKQKGGSDLAYGIAGGNRNGIKGSEFSNIVTYPTVSAGIKTYLFSVRPDPDTGDITMPTISNVYGVKKDDDSKKAGIQYDYRETNPLDGGDVGYKENGDEENFNSKTLEETCLTANSGKHAAWMSNTKQTGGADAVYFTLKGSEIRPVASADERIVQVIVNGNEGYANRGTKLDQAKLVDKANISTTQRITSIIVNGNDMTTQFADANYEYPLDADTTTIEIETECTHAGGRENRPVASEDGKKHALFCMECDSATEAAVDCTLTETPNGVDLANGTSSHVVTCSVCGRSETEVCNGTQEKNTADCTQNDIWNFGCSVHNGTYYVSGASGNKEHDFEGVEWKTVEGTNLQYMQCNICETKLYQIIAEVQVTGIKLAPGDQGTVEITLPEEVVSATLEFNLPDGFTVVKVNGEAPNGNTYSVTNYNKTPLVVTIEAADNVTAGDSFKVSMTDAKASDGSAVIADPATAQITINVDRGDANDDGDVNLQDALAVLQKVAGKNPPTCILANADMNANGEFDIVDVRLIVEYWAKETINNLKK